jgi:ribosomal protein S18 acetylase RimI-like enzyme
MERALCEIRTVRDTDRSMLLLLAEETLSPLAAGAGHPERYHTAELLELLDRADVFVAEVDGEIAGYVVVEGEDDSLALRCLCINPGFENRGVADQLVDWAEGLAVSWRLERLVAHIPSADQPSLKLYRGHGFVASPDPERPDLLAVAKRLPTVES